MKLTKKDGAPSYVSWLTETPKKLVRYPSYKLVYKPHEHPVTIVISCYI